MPDATAPDEAVLSGDDEAGLRRAIAVSGEALARGDRPFGATAVTADGRVFDAGNTEVTASDPTGHAETNLVRVLGGALSAEELRDTVMYASTEPCVMCSGAIDSAGLARLVYAIDGRGALRSRDVLAVGRRGVVVAGPALTEEALAVRDGA